MNTRPASSDPPAHTYMHFFLFFFQEQSITDISPFLFAKICSFLCKITMSRQFELSSTEHGVMYVAGWDWIGKRLSLTAD